MKIDLSRARDLKRLPRETQALRIFNLDLHTSVIQDLSSDLSSLAELVSWNSSNHNRFFRKDRPHPDPVSVVNQRTWKRLSSFRVWRFQVRYRFFLSSFDAFVVTYPFAFFTLFSKTRKPVLAVIATRFDWPMSVKQRRFAKFMALIRDASHSGRLVVFANNQGDADFFSLWTGLSAPRVIPSLCDYVFEQGLWQQPLQVGARITVQSNRLTPELKSTLEAVGIKDAAETYPNGYSWRDLEAAELVFFVPYNTSVMFLFELATLGTPVVIPDDDWLVSMALRAENGALSELYFPGSVAIGNSPHGRLGLDSEEAELRWWLSRADFSNKELMPNVIRVAEDANLADLVVERVSPGVLKLRNEAIRLRRREGLDEFIQRVCS